MANNKVLDTRQLMTGKDGRMYVNLDGVDTFMCAVDTFQVQMNFSNSDYQPVGSIVSFAVPINVTFTLTFSEAVVSDEYVSAPLLKAVKAGKVPTFDFSGVCERPDGEEQRMTFKNCTPDGAIDLMNLTPGDILKRAFSFRINSVPEYLKELAETV